MIKLLVRLFLVFCCAFYLGYACCQWVVVEPLRDRLDEATVTIPGNIITPDIAIEWLEESKQSHELYLNHPEILSKASGDIKHQLYCIGKYTMIIKLLEYLKPIDKGRR